MTPWEQVSYIFFAVGLIIGTVAAFLIAKGHR